MGAAVESYTGNGGRTNSNTQTITISAVVGDKLVAVVTVFDNAYDRTVTGVKVADGGSGIPFTSVVTKSRSYGSNYMRVHIWFLDNPPTGEQDVVISLSGTADNIRSGIFDTSGLDAGNASYTDTKQDTNETVSTTCTDNALSFSGGCQYSGPYIALDELIEDGNYTIGTGTSMIGHSVCDGTTESHRYDAPSTYYGTAMATWIGRPILTDCEDEDISESEEGVVLDGTDLSGSVVALEIGDASTYAGCAVKTTQTIDSNDGSQIEFDVVKGSLSYGQNWLYLTVDGITSLGYEINLYADNEITSAVATDFEPGESVVISGAHFGAAQSSSKVYLCDAADGSGTNTEQTVSAWADDEITVTAVKGSLSYGAAYLIVYRNNAATGDSADRKSNGETVNLHAVNAITSLDDYDFEAAAAVVLTGASWGASQGSSKVYLSDKVDGSGTNVEQTISAWGDTEITIAAVQGTLRGGVAYMIVSRNAAALGDLSAYLSDGVTIRLEVAAAADEYEIPNSAVELDPVSHGDLGHFERNYILTKGFKAAGISLKIRDNTRKVNLP